MTRRCWAIQYDPTEPDLVGFGWFNWQRPDHMTGYVTATWATREAAKRFLHGLRQSYPKARVVRVEIEYRIIGRKK